MAASEAGKEWANSGIRVKRVTQFLASAPSFGIIPIFLYELHRTMFKDGSLDCAQSHFAAAPGRHSQAEE